MIFFRHSNFVSDSDLVSSEGTPLGPSMSGNASESVAADASAGPQLQPFDGDNERSFASDAQLFDVALDSRTTARVVHWPRKADAPVSAVLYIVHGLSEHVGRWNRRAVEFAAAGFDVFAADHRGHGCSGGERTHMMRPTQLVEDLALVLTAVRSFAGMGRERPLCVFGHSLGGLIASAYAEAFFLADKQANSDALPSTMASLQRVAAREPICALALSAPALCTDQNYIVQKLAPLLALFKPQLRVPSEIKGEQLSSDPAVGEAYFADHFVTDTLAITAAFGRNTLALMELVQASLKELKLPVFLYHGEDDTLVPVRASEQLAAEAPDVAFERLPNTRHEAHNEAAGDAVLSKVVAFFAQHAAKK